MNTSFITVGILLLSLFGNSDKIYQRHIQLCAAVKAADRKWLLNLSEDGSFRYEIKTINTVAFVKESKQTFIGKWTMLNDTLNLKVDSSDIETQKLYKPQLQFVSKTGKLLPINEVPDTIGSFVMKLDFLDETVK